MNVGAVINRPGIRRIPSTGRPPKPGRGGRSMIAPTVGPVTPPRHSERNEVESKNLLRFEKESRTRSVGTRLSPLLRMTRRLGWFAWVGKGSKVGAFRADVPQSAPTGMTGRGTKPGAFRADVGIGPYGGAGTNFGLPPRYPKNVRHSERNEVESKNLLRSEKESRSNPPGASRHPPLHKGGMRVVPLHKGAMNVAPLD